MNFDRVPPSDLTAEQSVLGAMMAERGAIEKAVDCIGSGEFYHNAHVVLFDAIVTLYGARKGVDIVTLRDELIRLEVLEQIGGVTYLFQLQNAVPSAANVVHYAGIVHRCYIKRRLLDANNQIAEIVYSDIEDPAELANAAEKVVAAVAEGTRSSTHDVEPVSVAVDRVFAEMERRALGGSHVTGLRTGYDDLDYILGGLQRKELILIGARTSVGKSALAMQIGLYVSEHHGPVVAFSFEMSTDAITSRLIAGRARINSQTLRSGLLGADQRERAEEARESIRRVPLFIDDRPDVTAIGMRRALRRIKRDRGDVALMIVDHIGIMPSTGKHTNRYLEVGENSRELQRIAMEFNIPVIACAQLHRDADGERPVLRHLRESGNLEQDARAVLFIHRPKFSDDPTDDIVMAEEAEIIVAKNNNGPRNISLPVTYEPPYALFTTSTRRQGAPPESKPSAKSTTSKGYSGAAVSTTSSTSAPAPSPPRETFIDTFLEADPFGDEAQVDA